MVEPPSGVGNGGGGPAGGRDLHHPPPEHSLTVNCNQAHYGPVSGGGETPWENGVKAVVGLGVSGNGGDTYGILGGRTGRYRGVGG